jgi:uncharacterized protein YprB with RNaseH-like and TPR domain
LNYDQTYQQLTEHFPTSLIATPYGECLVLHVSHDLIAANIDVQDAKSKLFQDLTLLPGVAPLTEKGLKKKGYKSLHELAKHPRHGDNAQYLLSLIEEEDGAALHALLKESKGKFTSSHGVHLLTAAFFEPSDIVFLDIETCGLYDCPLFLIGVGAIQQNVLRMELIFMRNLREEKAALAYLQEYLSNKKAIVSFNGISFDLPFINKRLQEHRLPSPIKLPHFDAMRLATKIYRQETSAFNLGTLERELLDFHRVDDLPSALVPGYYFNYLDTGDVQPLIPILEHNKWDLVSTAALWLKFYE